MLYLWDRVLITNTGRGKVLFLWNSAQVSSDVARATLRQYRVLLARRGSVQICVRGKILCVQAMHSTTGSRSQALWSGR